MSKPDIRCRPLRKRDLKANPLAQFKAWLDEAVQADLAEPSAMALATAAPDGHPSVRMVLLRGVDENGLLFFSNYHSRKGREIEVNPRAALTIWWDRLGRQVRAEGPVKPAPAEVSDRYFNGRTRASRLGAWASEQSSAIANRAALERRMRALEREYDGRDIPRPPHWGGYLLKPLRIEFWQNRADRLHDRFLYLRMEDGSWRIRRLAP